MKLTMLGTGNAGVTKCYNTCFIIEDEGKNLLIDGGGGNGILRQLQETGYDLNDIHDIFVTHKHLDHLLGILWLIRFITQRMSRGHYEGELRIYGHDEVIGLLRMMALGLLQERETKLVDDRLRLITVNDGQTLTIQDHEVTFFDIQSTKDKQFGFTMDLGDGEKLTCCGDEPYKECERKYVEGSTWLLHEAFCLYAERDIYHPYEIHHSTVKDACELAEELGVKNLVLYHTEDRHLEERKELYGAEGRQYYRGNLYIPDDLEEVIIQ